MKGLFVFGLLAGCLPAVAVCKWSGYARAVRLMNRLVLFIPVLDEKNAVVCVRRLRPFSSCLTWSVVAGAYLNACGLPCWITFSAGMAGRFSAHAFLKFSDGTTIGEGHGLVELH